MDPQACRVPYPFAPPIHANQLSDLVEWSIRLQMIGRVRRTVPLLIEAVGLVKDRSGSHEATVLGTASAALGAVMHHLGRLDEAEAAFLQAARARRVAREYPRSSFLVDFAELFLELGRFDDVLRWGLEAERALEADDIGERLQFQVLSVIVGANKALGRHAAAAGTRSARARAATTVARQALVRMVAWAGRRKMYRTAWSIETMQRAGQWRGWMDRRRPSCESETHRWIV